MVLQHVHQPYSGLNTRAAGFLRQFWGIFATVRCERVFTVTAERVFCDSTVRRGGFCDGGARVFCEG